MRKSTILLPCVCIALAAGWSFLCYKAGKSLGTEALLKLVNERDAQSIDFLVYRAYKDADIDIARKVVTFTMSNPVEKSVTVGPLKVVVEPSLKLSENAIAEFGHVYNSHKSRAVYRRLLQSTPAVANDFLDGLETVGVLSRPERLGMPNIVDPY